MASYHILIVDDQHEVRRLLASGLKTLGPEFDVLDVPSAEEAMLLAFRRDLDLLVTDVRLPGISGLELVEKVRKRNPTLKIFLVTGISDQRIRDQVAASGADAFFYKPVPIMDFLQAVEHSLGLTQASTSSEIPLEEKTLPFSDPQSQLDLAYSYQHQQDETFTPSIDARLTLRLDLLRQDLNAQAVLLLNLESEVIARSGSLPYRLDWSVLGPILASIWNSGAKVTSALGMGLSQNIFFFSGPGYRLCQVPVGGDHSLLLIADKDLEVSQLGGLGSALLDAASDLYEILQSQNEEDEPRADSKTPVEPEVDDTLVEVTPEDLASVEAIFDQTASGNFDLSEVNAFWNELVEENDLFSLNENAITYDEARKLGLTPDEDES